MVEKTLTSTFNIVDLSTAIIEDEQSELTYFVRYKISDANGLDISTFSPITEIKQQDTSFLLNGFVPTYSISSVESGGQGINIKWTVPDSFPLSRFDIYFAWSWDSDPLTAEFSDFEYADTATSNSYYIKIPLQSSVKAKFVKAIVQVPTSQKIINTNALIVQTGVESTLPILDAGSIV